MPRDKRLVRLSMNWKISSMFELALWESNCYKHFKFFCSYFKLDFYENTIESIFEKKYAKNLMPNFYSNIEMILGKIVVV